MTLVQADPSQLDVHDDPDATVVAWCERGSVAIEQAATLADAKDIRDWADTIEHASKVRDLNHETIILASALKIRAERRIGQLLGPAQNGGDRRSDQFGSERTDLTKDDRYDFRKLAAPDEDEFEEALTEAAEDAADKAGMSRRSVREKLARQRQDDAQPRTGGAGPPNTPAIPDMTTGTS